MALKFCGSSFLRMDDFLSFVGTNFCEDRFSCWMVIFAIFRKSRLIAKRASDVITQTNSEKQNGVVKDLTLFPSA